MTSRRPLRTAGERRQQLDAVQAMLTVEVRNLRTALDWEGVLGQIARMPGQSFANVLLIFAQYPGATMVADYGTWQALGRQVTKDQKGIAVFGAAAPPSGETGTAPHPATAEDQRSLAYVWDISQTSGALVSAAQPASQAAGLSDALALAARREGFAVEREYCAGADALTLWAARRIRVRPGMTEPAEATAILHQLAHLIMHGHLHDPPCATAAGCSGILRLEADSVAHITAARAGVSGPGAFPDIAAWAGTDPRARPELTLRATAERITAAAAELSARLAGTLPPGAFITAPAAAATPALASPARNRGERAATQARTRPEPAHAGQPPAPAGQPPAPAAILFRVLADAEQFFLAQGPRSWVPSFARSRGLGDDAISRWRIGHAPAGWTALTDHLRRIGHPDDVIEAAGLARRSSRGTLVDHFRDRAMIAIRSEHDAIAGYIGRAGPTAGPAVPKYLNSPQTAVYAKGELLLGLSPAREALMRGAVPVLAEGPFDAIAVTSCDPARYAGLAACGTALTERQIASLSHACDLPATGILIAADGDRAGRQAAVRAYRIVRNYTERSAWVTFPAGQDPAEIFQARGPAALSHALSHDTRPLARLPVDDVIDQHGHVRDSPHEALTAMRAAARVIADLLTARAARDISTVTLGHELRTWTDDLRPIADPAVPKIAAVLAADTMIQIAATADRLSFDYSDVITELANQVTQHARMTPRASRHELGHQSHPSLDHPDALAAISFPPGPEPGLARRAPPVPPVASYSYRPRASARPEATRHL